MEQSEINLNLEYIQSAVDQKEKEVLMGHIAVSLMRIANAQDEIVELAKADIQATVEEEIKARAETMASEMEADKSKRSFIGKK